MPAVSKAQQRFMGMVHSTQKGDIESPSKEVEKVADTMKKVDVKDFASTKHKGLPSYVKERLKEIIRGVIRAEGAFGSVIGGPEDGRNLNEMSPKDIHFKAILAMYDKGASFTKKKVAVAVSNNPNASRNKIIDDLKDLNYHEILDAEDQLGIDESVLNEEHDCGCNENHDCGCGGVHEHIHEDLSADANGIAGLTASRASAVKDFLEKNNINSNKLYLFLKKGNLKDRMDFVTALVGNPGNPIQKKVVSQFSK